MDLQPAFENAVKGSRVLNQLSREQINTILFDIASAARQYSMEILEANQKDLDRMDRNDPKYDRLLLNAGRIESIAGDIENVAGLPSPLGQVLMEKKLENGLDLRKVRVPIGVVGIIYEARPNVTFDVAALCLKTGNACVLKGGSDAMYTNEAILKAIQRALKKHDLPDYLATLLPPDREATAQLLGADQYVDILIPRGSQRLINYVRENAKAPVIETGAGIVHTYVDASANDEKAKNIVVNAKTRRVSVCNALDCLVIHRNKLNLLPSIATEMEKHNVVIYADEAAYQMLEGHYPGSLLNPAQPEHFGTEFLDYKMAIKTVDDLDDAIEHIQTYTSRHSEAIVAEDVDAIEKFLNTVDAAAVYANTSTAFTDGAQFGLGAEIGISTQKLHARGPMALEELTSYKWVIRGDGQVRPK
ncbi:MAG TPA: glutamate-5-semialdehyde dehydrogenase [Cytophagales bacterium]|jgi:glutamate-5-semialdehyde dehydrogenase|nr:glutamate-5-semialdehyde dehydrogenase [Cytophagales bacterium]